MMDRARVDELWSRFLSGKALPPEEEVELADALEADPRLLADLSQDLACDRSLRGLGLADRNEDDFVNSFSYRLRTERDGTRFIATVKHKMKRSRRPPTRRWERAGIPAARVGFAAAVLIAILVLILAASSSSPAPKPDAPSARRPTERVEQPEPQAPAPAPEAPRPERSPLPDRSAPLTPRTFPTPVAPNPEPPPPPPVIVDNGDKPAPSTVGSPQRPLATVATFSRTSGDVAVASVPVKAGQKLYAGQTVETTGPKSGAQMLFADGTRVDLAPDTLVSEVAETRGKRIVLARGTLTADVAKQPPDQPMVVSTPHGEAKVLGTVFRLSVEPGTMRLDVKEGRVRLTRASDLKAVDVPAGCFASAGPEKGDLDLNSEHKVTVSFQDGVSPTPRYAGTSDAILVEAPKAAEKNTGAYAQLWVDGDTTVGDDRYTLLRWDLPGVPARCTVISATIELQVTNDSRGTTFDLFEIKRDWVEKETTWKLASTKAPWQTPGAQGVQDRGTAVLGVAGPRQPGLHPIKLSPEGLAVVQSWIDAPATNHGIIIANPDNQDAIGFHSREASLPANRPRLTITFIPRAK